MHVREGTKRKDACLNAESSITGSRSLSQLPRRRLFLFEVYIDCRERDTTSRWKKFTNSTETEQFGGFCRSATCLSANQSRKGRRNQSPALTCRGRKGQLNQVPFRGRHNRLA